MCGFVGILDFYLCALSIAYCQDSVSNVSPRLSVNAKAHAILTLLSRLPDISLGSTPP
jgi:hypothetical protein